LGIYDMRATAPRTWNMMAQASEKDRAVKLPLVVAVIVGYAPGPPPLS
jgi:hypothetical protein